MDTADNQQSAEEFLHNYQIFLESSTGIRTHYGPGDHAASMGRLFGAREPTEQERVEMSRVSSDMRSETDLVRKLSARLIGALPDKERSRLARIPVGTLPTSSFNGRVLRIPSGENIVVINAGLPATLFEIAQNFVGSRSFPGSPPEIPFEKATMNIFLHAFYQAAGRVLTVPERSYVDFPDRRFTVGALWTNGLFFVLGHEYAHILKGHLRESSSRQYTPEDGAAPLLDYNRSHQQEFEADELGLRSVVRFAKSDEGGSWAGVGILGAELVLQALVMVESLGVRPSVSSHPSASLRLERLHALQEPMLDDFTFKLVDELRRVFAVTTVVAENFLRRVKEAREGGGGGQTPNLIAEADC